tara:strand:- start:5837 stop:6151 length:315 start_codon:yes stop_codon:yes gene_type:complete
MAFSWQKAYELGEFVYKGIKTAKSISSKLSRGVDPEQHVMSRPFSNVSGTARRFRSGENRNVSASGYDVTGDKGSMGVTTDGTTGYSKDINFVLAKLRGLTRNI